MIFVVAVFALFGVAINVIKKGAPQAQRSNQMICPHCQTKGSVSVRSTKVKRGISGGKATGAVLTGGLSMLATGLSRKEKRLRARCGNCGVAWLI